jgi:hypothetical protein
MGLADNKTTMMASSRSYLLARRLSPASKSHRPQTSSIPAYQIEKYHGD